MTMYNVSPSVLADVAACKTKAYVRHVLGYAEREDAVAARAGTAMHAAIAEYLSPREDHEDPLAVFRAVYDDYFTTLQAEDLQPRLTPANLHRVLSRWLEMHPPSALPWARVLEVETAFVSRVFNVPGAAIDINQQARPIIHVNLIVRPDAVVERLDGRVVAVDTKTTGWFSEPWKYEFRTMGQMSAYIDAVNRRYPDRGALGMWVNAIELRALPDSDRKCATHKLTYAECGNEHAKMELIEVMRTEEIIARWALDAENAVRDFVQLQQTAINVAGLRDASAIADIPMDGALNGRCRFCPMAKWCADGRPMAAMDDYFVHSPWVVDEGPRVPAGA